SERRQGESECEPARAVALRPAPVGKHEPDHERQDDGLEVHQLAEVAAHRHDREGEGRHQRGHAGTLAAEQAEEADGDYETETPVVVVKVAPRVRRVDRQQGSEQDDERWPGDERQPGRPMPRRYHRRSQAGAAARMPPGEMASRTTPRTSATARPFSRKRTARGASATRTSSAATNAPPGAPPSTWGTAPSITSRSWISSAST